MGITVGMPTMFLGRQSGAPGGRVGNAKAVLCEALEERWTADPDYKYERTKDNIYLTDVKSGLDLAQKWTIRANNYVQVQKNGKERKLRSDAHIGFAGVCKPAGDSEYGGYTEEQQIQFCRDSFDVLKKVYAKYGITLDYGVIQLDEGVPHMHYGGHDDDFRLGKRIRLKLFNDLNKGDYISLMKQKGWAVEPLKGYDAERAAKMSPDELAAYKAEQIELKRKHPKGKSARQYKAEKERKKAEEQREQLKEEQQKLERRKEDVLEIYGSMTANAEVETKGLFRRKTTGMISVPEDQYNMLIDFMEHYKSAEENFVATKRDAEITARRKKQAVQDSKDAAQALADANAAKEKQSELIRAEAKKIAKTVAIRENAREFSIMKAFIESNPKRKANYDAYRSKIEQQDEQDKQDFEDKANYVNSQTPQDDEIQPL